MNTSHTLLTLVRLLTVVSVVSVVTLARAQSTQMNLNELQASFSRTANVALQQARHTMEKPLVPEATGSCSMSVLQKVLQKVQQVAGLHGPVMLFLHSIPFVCILFHF